MTYSKILHRPIAAAMLVLACACGGSQPSTAPPEAPPEPQPTEPEPAPEELDTTQPPGEPTEAPGTEPTAPAPEEPEAAIPHATDDALAATSTVTDAEVQAFSKIQLELIELIEAAEQRLMQGEDPEALSAEMEKKAVALVEASPLSVPRFKEILALVEQDPELMRRVEDQLRQMIPASQ